VAHRFERDVERLEYFRSETVTLVDQPEEDVLSAHEE
jgi:hypothetical protein